MVSEARGRLFRRKDGKYLIYLPVDLAEDSMFPFKDFGEGRRGALGTIPVKISFTPGEEKLILEMWKKRPEETPDIPEGQ